MKNIRTTLLMAGMILLYAGASAQTQKNNPPVTEPDYNKPRLFENLPARIPVTVEELDNLVNSSAGRNTSFKISGEPGLQFDGEVVSTASKYENRIQSTVLRASNFNGASVTVSRILQDDGTYTYTGRIISFTHGDLFELRNESGAYVLVKKNYYELVNE